MLEFDPELVRRLSAQTERRVFGAEPDPGAVRALRSCWQTELTECQRRYLLHYYRDCMTMRAIAEQYGVTVPTVSRTLARARCRLRRILKYYYGE